MLKTKIGERKTTDLQGIYPVYRLTYLIVDHQQRKNHTPIRIQIPSDKRKAIRLEQLPRQEKYYQYQPTKSERIKLISFPDCVIQPIHDDR